jgi:hypothetical protein
VSYGGLGVEGVVQLAGRELLNIHTLSAQNQCRNGPFRWMDGMKGGGEMRTAYRSESQCDSEGSTSPDPFRRCLQNLGAWRSAANRWMSILRVLSQWTNHFYLPEDVKAWLKSAAVGGSWKVHQKKVTSSVQCRPVPTREGQH